MRAGLDKERNRARYRRIKYRETGGIFFWHLQLLFCLAWVQKGCGFRQSDLFTSSLSPFEGCVELHLFCPFGIKLRLNVDEFSHHLP